MNFIRDNIFLIGVAAYCIGALLWPYIRTTAKVNNSEATTLINKGKTTILDIRTRKEYQSGHLLNAVSMPFLSLKDQLGQLEESFKKQPVLLIDHEGKDSAAAAKILKENGFTKINILKGGMASWTKEGLPTTK